MVDGMRTAADVERLVRKVTRKGGSTVVRETDRGKGSHYWLIVTTATGVVARFKLTGHPGDMSHAVTRSNEQVGERIFGEGWMDK